jgi:S-disulfanyl-L-cysteine oxidoreductase SoxD
MFRSSEHRVRTAIAATILLTTLGGVPIGDAAAQDRGPQRFGIGRAATPAEIKGWDIDVRADDGLGLPPGKGTVAAGEKLYQEQCASCHGEFGEGNGRWPELIGGEKTLKSDDPRRTVASYWPYAPGIFDYVRRTMPFAAPQSLSDDDTYAIVAYLLNINDLLPADATLDAATLKAVRMPNRDGFVHGDPRPDVPMGEPCMSKCRKDPPKITSDLAQRLGVTPDNRRQK